MTPHVTGILTAACLAFTALPASAEMRLTIPCSSFAMSSVSDVRAPGTTQTQDVIQPAAMPQQPGQTNPGQALVEVQCLAAESDGIIVDAEWQVIRKSQRAASPAAFAARPAVDALIQRQSTAMQIAMLRGAMRVIVADKRIAPEESSFLQTLISASPFSQAEARQLLGLTN